MTLLVGLGHEEIGSVVKDRNFHDIITSKLRLAAYYGVGKGYR